jgi:TetR/AcrR family transcriptional regulator
LSSDAVQGRAARLPAPERRQALLETAMRVFSARSYRGVTTAEIAREAGVSEPILYRHFASKRDLYLACLDEAWKELREAFETAVAGVEDASDWLPALVSTAAERHKRKAFLANLWIQALTEAADDAEIRGFLRAHVREVHDYLATTLRRCQADGGLFPDRDVDAEAWIFLAVGLLTTFAQRLGGVLKEPDLEAIRQSRLRWLVPGAP